MLNSTSTDFKIILNSNDTTTWTGTKYNASYFLDLKQKLHKDELFDKSYKMTFNFISTNDASLNSSRIYTIALNLNNGANLYGVHQPVGSTTTTTAPLSLMYDTATTANYFNSTDADNSPTFISNLRSIQSINVKLMDYTYALYTGTINYMVVLHFTEIK